MPALNFQARFADAVEARVKRHTVRLERKRPIQPGDTLHLYTGMRTKACRRLGPPETCTENRPIVVEADPQAGFTVTMDGRRLGRAEASAFAQADGLASAHELYEWVRDHYGLPFRGVVHYW